MEGPLKVARRTAIPLSEVELRASRSSGPGGQHANVTASRVEAVFDVQASAALSDAQKQRLIEKLGRQVTAVAQDARSQARNRELALERLREKIADGLVVPKKRHETKPSRASKLERIEKKRLAGRRKQERRRPGLED
jgi:ribosome-associated protein